MRHLSIIPDGNRRWAKNKGLSPVRGYVASGSYDHIKSLFEVLREYQIPYFSLWAFSTENWKRDKIQINGLFEVIERGIEKLTDEAESNKIRFMHCGRKDRISERLRDKIVNLEEVTKHFKNSIFLMGIDYGGRDEIVRAINKIIKSGKDSVNEEEVKTFLDTKDIPDPDLIIRTGGEKRLSGFLPFQTTYSELFFTDVFFPDFKPEDLRLAIREYESRERRIGK